MCEVEFNGSLLHNCFYISLSLHIFLSSFHFSSLSFLTSSINVFLGLPLFLFPYSFASYFFLASISSPTLVTYPSRHNCPRCVVSSIDSTFSLSLFLILFDLVLFIILLRNLTSVLFIFLLCLLLEVYDSHKCANISFTTLLTTSTFTSCGISILLGTMFLLHYIVFQF